MSESQQWHLNYLIGKYKDYKESQGYPCYLAFADYFQEDGGPEISDSEHAEVFKAFCDYVLSEEITE